MARRVKIDMTGVESYGRVSEGQHVAKVIAAESVTTQGGNDAIKVTFEVTKGIDKGNRVIETFPLTDTALWKLKGLLVAIGMKCDGKITLDLDKLIGKMVIIEVAHEEYNGSMRAKVQEYKKLTGDSDEDDEDEDFDEDEDDDEDEEEEEKPTPKKKSAPKKSTKKAAPKKETKKVEEEDDEDEDWDDEEDDEEEKPKKKAPAKKSTKKAPAKKKVEEEDEEDWDEDDDEDWEED